eukprot:gene12345-biopygen3368
MSVHRYYKGQLGKCEDEAKVSDGGGGGLELSKFGSCGIPNAIKGYKCMSSSIGQQYPRFRGPVLAVEGGQEEGSGRPKTRRGGTSSGYLLLGNTVNRMHVLKQGGGNIANASGNGTLTDTVLEVEGRDWGGVHRDMVWGQSAPKPYLGALLPSHVQPRSKESPPSRDMAGEDHITPPQPPSNPHFLLPETTFRIDQGAPSYE